MPKPKDPQPIVDEAVRILSGLPGIVGTNQIQRAVMEQVVELENRYAQGALAPTRNVGVRITAARDAVIGVLKNKHFRGAPEPTVYMVEESPGNDGPGNDGPAEHYVTVEGERYLIVGEEVFASRLPYLEETVSLGDSFVIFPNRASSGTVPSFFIIPPLEFFELETIAGQLGIRGVISVSPSSLTDRYLRDVCGFPADPSLATLLVAFDVGSAG